MFQIFWKQQSAVLVKRSITTGFAARSLPRNNAFGARSDDTMTCRCVGKKTAHFGPLNNFRVTLRDWHSSSNHYVSYSSRLVCVCHCGEACQDLGKCAHRVLFSVFKTFCDQSFQLCSFSKAMLLKNIPHYTKHRRNNEEIQLFVHMSLGVCGQGQSAHEFARSAGAWVPDR